MSINDTERHRGRWRFAGDEGAFVPGVLVIDPDGQLSLGLSGLLDRASPDDEASADKLMRGTRRILGELENFSSVSLNGCFLRRASSLSPAPLQIWHVHEAIFGVMFSANDCTHWSSPLAAKALRGGDAVHLTSRLRALLAILLLRDLGFAPDSAAERAVLQRRISWLPERWEQESRR